MWNNRRKLVTVVSIFLMGVQSAFAQMSSSKELLPRVFGESDLPLLRNGETTVRILPTDNKSELAVCGLAPLTASAEMFLDSFRKNLVRKTNSAILEIGAFSQTPRLEDLQALTIEDSDIEDLRACNVGDCQLKLSRSMISGFKTNVDWNAPNYKTQAAEVFKRMLVEYVVDYLARGETALIRYADKPQIAGVAEGYQQLVRDSGYEELTGPSAPAKTRFELVEKMIVWSKLNFGLKPVININDVAIYKDVQNPLSQVLIVSKQIYANHYFDASLALTAYIRTSGEVRSSYLFYENRSLIDGLGGPLGKIKRGVVEHRALTALSSFLTQSQMSFNNRAFSASASNVDEMSMQTLGRWKLRQWAFIVVPLWTVLVILFFARGPYLGKQKT